LKVEGRKEEGNTHLLTELSMKEGRNVMIARKTGPTTGPTTGRTVGQNVVMKVAIFTTTNSNKSLLTIKPRQAAPQLLRPRAPGIYRGARNQKVPAANTRFNKVLLVLNRRMRGALMLEVLVSQPFEKRVILSRIIRARLWIIGLILYKMKRVENQQNLIRS
jgi:hypothetical protein